jgi:Ca-activated chloride channel family protein
MCAFLALAGLAGGPLARANDGTRDFAVAVNKANALLRNGNVDAAIGAYQQAQQLAPESPDLSYNTAVAQYRKGDVAAAAHLFQTAATTENDAIAAKARYNLGNCDYASALQQAKQDRPAAIKHLESAITNYRSALDVDPHDADARANIELAARLIDQLCEEQKQQEQKKQEQQQDEQQKQKEQQQSKDQQQNNQQQNGEQQKRDQQQQQSQSAQQKENQSAQNKPQQGDEQSKQDQSKNEQSKEKQSSEDKAESQSQDQHDSGNNDKQQSQPQQPQSQPSQQPQAAKKQSQRQEQNPLPQPDEPSDKQGQQPPQGELSAAGAKDENSDDQNQKDVAAFDSSQDGEMTQQEAEKMLQAIRDRDMIRRLRRQAAERNQHVPVDRDW